MKKRINTKGLHSVSRINVSGPPKNKSQITPFYKITILFYFPFKYQNRWFLDDFSGCCGRVLLCGAVLRRRVCSRPSPCARSLWSPYTRTWRGSETWTGNTWWAPPSYLALLLDWIQSNHDYLHKKEIFSIIKTDFSLNVISI